MWKWILLLIGSMTSAGCGHSREYDGPQRFPISGTVKCNGVPLDAGTISFVPLDSESGRLSGGPIVNGEYSVEEAKGPTAAMYRIELLWHKATGKKYPDSMGTGEMHDVRVQVLPPRFQQGSQLTARVGDGMTKFDFDLTIPESELDRALNLGARAFRPE